MALHLSLALALGALTPTDLEPVCVGDFAPHSAFTDIARSGGRLFCAFRESDSHALGADGKIRVIVQGEDSSWSSFALLELEGIDLRDPKLSGSVVNLFRLKSKLPPTVMDPRLSGSVVN